MRHTKRSDDGEAAAAGHRHERLTRLLHEEIAALVRDELDDPRLAGVLITYVELSVDYKNARVGFVVDADGDRERATAALLRATPLLRARMADGIDLKVVPALRFVWDVFAAAAPQELRGTSP